MGLVPSRSRGVECSPLGVVRRSALETTSDLAWPTSILPLQHFDGDVSIVWRARASSKGTHPVKPAPPSLFLLQRPVADLDWAHLPRAGRAKRARREGTRPNKARQGQTRRAWDEDEAMITRVHATAPFFRVRMTTPWHCYCYYALC